MTSVALCAIMKDEFPYLLEWIAYHRLIGFEPIVIYSNDATDGSVELLGALADHGVIVHRTQKTSSDIPPQHAAYQDALAKSGAEWMGFLDADEFLVLKQDADVGGLVARFPASVSAVAIHWRIFGSSGHSRYGSDLVIERFTRASLKDHSINSHFKTLARASRVEHMSTHFARLKSGAYVNSGGEAIADENSGRAKPVETEIAQINHYCVKSKEEFEWKRKRGAADRVLNDPAKYTHRDPGHYYDYHDRNEVEDLSLFHIKDAVKREIGILRGLLARSGFLFFR